MGVVTEDRVAVVAVWSVIHRSLPAGAGSPSQPASQVHMGQHERAPPRPAPASAAVTGDNICYDVQRMRKLLSRRIPDKWTEPGNGTVSMSVSVAKASSRRSQGGSLGLAALRRYTRGKESRLVTWGRGP